MKFLKNPFEHLYVTERVAPDSFVRLVSPYLVPHVQGLFQNGNVFILGTQGSGKSTLLAYLKSEIRAAYSRADVNYPVISDFTKFLCAGINLHTSDSLSIGRRPVDAQGAGNAQAPLFFGDFVNYWVLSDILDQLFFVSDNQGAFNFKINIDALDSFAVNVAKKECWFGYFSMVNDFTSLKSKIRERILEYRMFAQLNRDSLSDELVNSKTNVGEPLSQVVRSLKELDILDSDVSFFIRVDEANRLSEMKGEYRDLGLSFRRVLNKALATRDPHISYKIGMRTHAFSQDLTIYGTDNEIENKRDYSVVDIDDLLRRKENRSTWLFPDFAKDVFIRRIYSAFGPSECEQDGASELYNKIFGQTHNARDIAKNHYAKTCSFRTALKISTFPDHWVGFLEELYKKDPLDAILASAWLRQGKSKQRLASKPCDYKQYPWAKTYWRKERIRMALMHLSARCKQRMFWSGGEQILSLSGDAILIFVSICQHIWDCYIRALRNALSSSDFKFDDLSVPDYVQSVGVLSASSHWINKISEIMGGADRKRFVRFLGTFLKKSLMSDFKMTYPGYNGFSISIDDLETHKFVYDYLNSAASYGVLIKSEHTTKKSDGKHRYKWYLNSIYYPYFNLYEAHIKEPMYISAAEVGEWIDASYKDDFSTFVCDDDEDKNIQFSLFR